MTGSSVIYNGFLFNIFFVMFLCSGRRWLKLATRPLAVYFPTHRVVSHRNELIMESMSVVLCRLTPMPDAERK